MGSSVTASKIYRAIVDNRGIVENNWFPLSFVRVLSFLKLHFLVNQQCHLSTLITSEANDFLLSSEMH